MIPPDRELDDRAGLAVHRGRCDPAQPKIQAAAVTVEDAELSFAGRSAR